MNHKKINDLLIERQMRDKLVPYTDRNKISFAASFGEKPPVAAAQKSWEDIELLITHVWLESRLHKLFTFLL